MSLGGISNRYFLCAGHYGRFPVWPGKLGAWTRDSIAVLVFCAVFSGLYLFLFVLGVAEFLVALPVQLLIWGVLWVSR